MDKTEIKKVPKKKGPIRVEAIVPFAIVSTLIALYFALFFDMHLKSGIEYGATLLNGAEVNVSRVKTSFFGASFLAEKIQLTNPNQPEKNRVEVGRIQFRLLWDGLLRGKFVVNLAEVLEILADTPRDKPGEVLPPEKREERNAFKKEILAKLKDQFQNTELGQFAKLLEGFDPAQQIKDLGNLESVAYMDKLEKDLGEKEKMWTQGLQSLPKDEDFNNVQTKLRAVKIGNNPAEAKNAITQITSTLKETESQVTAVTSKATTLQEDVKGFEGSVAGIDDVVAKDRKNQEKKLNIPDVSPQNLTGQFFGNSFSGQIQQVGQYKAMLEQYIPSKGSKEERGEVEVQRMKGRSYQFGKPQAYPSFWLRRAVVSSKATEGAFAGNVDGEVVDLCSDQSVLGRPTTVNVRGNFPQRGINGVFLQALLDHGKTPARASAAISVESYPVEQRPFVNSDAVKFAIKQATGRSSLKVAMEGKKVQLVTDNEFRKAQYDVSASSKLLDSVLKSTLANLPTLSIGGRAEGTWQDLKWSLNSNLGDALQKGFSAQLGQKLAEARKKIDAMIDEKVGGKKRALTAKFNDTKTKVTSQIEAKKKKAEETKMLAMAKLDEAKQKATSAPVQKALGGAKKKFGF